MTPLAITAFTATCCLGRGNEAILSALLGQRSGLAPCTFETVDLPTCVGEVPAVDEETLPEGLRDFDCRNNRLAWLGLSQDGFLEEVQECASSTGTRRVGVFLGTSTAGILQTELAYRNRDPTGALPREFLYGTTQNSFSLAAFVGRALGLDGPAAVVSSACSSSAKVFGSARRMIEAGLIDAAVVGGVDSLCLTTLYGFHSLQLTSPHPCRPFDVERDGISISEAAAFALIERADGARARDSIRLLGVGESSDAYHMSSPHPEGLGARAAILQALSAAHLSAGDIGYINLHGTGTQSNDSSEARAIAGMFPPQTLASSTKGATGHALGAAGALEAIICALCLQHDFAPAGVNTRTVDPALPVHYLHENLAGRLPHILSNSFGFGGTNCCLILGQPGCTGA